MRLFPRHSRQGNTEHDPSSGDAQGTEIRLALVMNGGVSLAVWMAGVTHEIDLLRRASHVDPQVSANGVSQHDMPVFKIWQRLAGETHKNVRVDVISGTSAGGLNGLLLATAIARGATLSSLRETWMSASLMELLPGPQSSLLSGQMLEDKIKDALPATKGSPPETVTLFVTATALDGQPRTFTDSYGRHFDVRDHRRVYRFKNHPIEADTPRAWMYTNEDGSWRFKRAERQEFGADYESALLRAARATASFPIAFTPVSEDLLLDHRVRPDPLYQAPASCVMDGGVLNNAPFGPVLDEITKHRVARRPVKRVLVYVVPSAGRLPDEKAKGPCEDIPPGSVGMSALNYPQEVDLRSGTEDLKHRLETSVRDTREHLFQRLADADTGAQLCGQLHKAASSLLGEYRRSRIKAVLLDVLNEQSRTQPATALGPPTETNDDAIAPVLDMDCSWFPPDNTKELEKPKLDRWCWGVITAERMLQTLGHYLHDLVSPDRWKSALSQKQRTKLLSGARDINDGLRELLAVTDAIHAELKQESSSGGQMDPKQAAGLVDRMFKELNLPEVVGARVDKAAKDFLRALKEAQISTHWRRPGEVISACLTMEVLTQAFAPPAKVVDKLMPKFEFMRLGPDELGPLFNEDWSVGLGDRKLYGIRFRHFGAFISDERHEWRQSDFAWGRLDAAHHLLPLLLPDDAPPDLIERQENELHRTILAAEVPPGELPEEWMRKRLAELANKRDSELLDDDIATSLRETGDRAVRLFMSESWLARAGAVRVWRRAFKIWRRGRGRVSFREAVRRALSLPRWPEHRS
ncbi:patatin-like phospholipase family protein [Kitasatospora aureofaciens]|uniref:patatin-like phospholipase family protein n=1 Tax=Kitasatospora aureofaciens TaxID=1894 RepID=UPI003400AA5E